jgi:hypothetical protein
MSAEIIPFPRSTLDAWKAYLALRDEAEANPRLMVDMDHLERRIAASQRYFRLVRRRP